MDKYFDKKNLHHAYLIEGEHEVIVPAILELLNEFNIPTNTNPDFYHLILDVFKIEDARNLRDLAQTMSFTREHKRIFLVQINSFLLEAQNTLLKLFEDPIPNSHFFIVMPDTGAVLPTLLSRFYFIPSDTLKGSGAKSGEFIKMNAQNRILFIKDMLAEDEEDESGISSARTKALLFINSLEQDLQKCLLQNTVRNPKIFEQIFIIREFLRQPGSSVKTLLESAALLIPVLQ